jgi:hypothetical protein
MNTSVSPDGSQPWWKYGHLWMVIGGPLIVVIASFFTLYLAVRTPDPVYSDRPGTRAADDNDGKANLTPALQARNHAATGGAGLAPKTPKSSASAPSTP